MVQAGCQLATTPDSEDLKVEIEAAERDKASKQFTAILYIHHEPLDCSQTLNDSADAVLGKTMNNVHNGSIPYIATAAFAPSVIQGDQHLQHTTNESCCMNCYDRLIVSTISTTSYVGSASAT